MLPPNAKVGECYARVLVPPVYEKTTEQMLVKEASSTIEIIPAKYEWVEEQILVREASERLIVIPAEYGTVKVRKLVSSPREVRTPIKEEFKTVSKSVMVEASYMEWRQILCETNKNLASGQLTFETVDALGL